MQTSEGIKSRYQTSSNESLTHSSETALRGCVEGERQQGGSLKRNIKHDSGTRGILDKLKEGIVSKHFKMVVGIDRSLMDNVQEESKRILRQLVQYGKSDDDITWQ